MGEGQYPKTNGNIFYAIEANMSYYQGVLSTTATNGAVSVTSSATSIKGADADRKKILIRNNGAATVYIGVSGVTTVTGIPVSASACIVLNTVGVIYGITSSVTCDVRYIEVK